MTGALDVYLHWDPAMVDCVTVTGISGTAYVPITSGDLRWLMRLSRRSFRCATRLQERELNQRLVVLAKGAAILDARARLSKTQQRVPRRTEPRGPQVGSQDEPQPEDLGELPF